jgi:RNA recognition motif-containing protein
MSSEEAGKKAIEMFNGKQVMERSIVVNEAKPQEKRGPGGGGFKSRGGYGDKRGDRR